MNKLVKEKILSILEDKHFQADQQQMEYRYRSDTAQNPNQEITQYNIWLNEKKLLAKCINFVKELE